MFVIPFLVLTILNCFLIRVLQGRVSGFDLNASRRQNHNKTVVTKRIVIIVVLFVILELPVFIMNILNGLRRHGVSLGLDSGNDIIHLLQSSYVISGMNSVVNFYVYFLTGSSFRHTLWKMTSGKRIATRPDRPSQSGHSENDLAGTPVTEVTALQAVCVQVTQRSGNSFLSGIKRNSSSPTIVDVAIDFV
jgi:hypothetical protein